ncbi:YjbH domain-containing protein [Christiangramia echinicola]|uniref:Exopolysaccharide biosynthesis protein YbjH n=1 Tax=Christiangramia echinicola TaxID=279359 RepID=A0A1H1LU67_9FLAO|nr:YjbH domain-containing protein [Christiangramia echinicola]SDR77862.1 Exopolysaccharide biosynthesis protein YbjH [Christiangramia echinicola]
MRKLRISLLFILLSLGLHSQETESQLGEAGFENITLETEVDSLKLYFEHREFRNPYHGMLYANRLLGKADPELPRKNSTFFPVFHNQLMGRYEAQTYNFSPLSESDRHFYAENNKVFKNYRFNFRLHPEVVSRFGYYEDPFETKFNMILDTRIYLASGVSLQTGITIPIVNNLDNHGMKLRAAPSMLHYFVQPWNAHFFSLSAGTFYNDRYGFDLEYRFARMDSRWSFGFAGGVTGFYRLYGLEYYSEPVDDLYGVADVEWRTGIEHTTLKLSAGQFLYQDKGMRLDLIKQFAAAELGLFAARTDIGTTGGFQFAFSLFPGKILRGKKNEVRTTEEFRWEYTYNNEDPVAQQFRIGMPRLADLLRNYNEAWIKHLSNNN